MATEDARGREQYVNRRYRVVRQLGTGGMGTVYLVEDTLEEDQLLALKTIRTGLTSSYSYGAFRNEFQAMTQFHHPNVVEVYEFGTLGPNEDFFTMEVVDGHNLLDATVNAPLERIYDYAAQIGRALEYIHSQGFIHFDLKPDNIMVRPGGAVKVMDFGLVEDIAHIQTGTVKGSVHYIAPEMVRGTAMDARYDLYSLGAVLFHIIAGRPLYDGDAAAVMKQHVSGEPDFDRDVKRPFPPPLRALLSRLLAKSPADRPASASDFLVELGRIDGTAGNLVAATEADESYVLGSRFVGRESQLARLKQVFVERVEQLDPATPPLALLAGPAGIGRSRLAQELRHHVQLRGVRFAHGSSLEDGGQPGLPFSEIIRALVREILPSERGEELSTFRDALGIGYSISGGRPAGAAQGATMGHTATMAPSSTRTERQQTQRLQGDLLPDSSDPAPGQPDGEAETPLDRTVALRDPARHSLPAGALSNEGSGQRQESTSLGVIYSARTASGEAAAAAANAETIRELGARANAQLVALLRPSAAALARLLPDQPALAELSKSEGGAPAFSSPKAEREWLLRSIARFLVDAARVRPLVLYVSDLHWADELTIELLGHLARDLAGAASQRGEPSRFLLVACYRSEEVTGTPLERAIATLVGERAAQVIALGAMGEAELGQMLRSMLGPVSVTPRLSQLLLERTGGSPFLIEATVRSLLHAGALARSGATFSLGGSGEAAMAEALGSVEEVLDRTLEQLGPRELEVLQLLAVFNRPTSAKVLRLARPDLPDLQRALAPLQKKRFLQRGWADGSYQYRLRHNQLRAHLYRALDPATAARLHQAAGTALESQHGGSERYLEDLAQHFHRAGNLEKSIGYARAAGDHARRLYDGKRAAALYLQAYEALAQLAPESVAPTALHDRRRDQAELAVSIAAATYYSPSEANIERLQRAAAIAAALADRDLDNRVQNWMGRTFYALGKQREAIRCFQEFMKGTAGTADDITRALPFAVLGRVCFFLGRFETARDYLGRACGLLREVAGTEEDLSYALGMGGSAASYLGDLQEGIAMIDESIAIATRINHRTRLGLGHIYRGICLCHFGHWDDARASLDQGLEICARTGDVIGTGTGSSFRGQVALAGGDAQEAVRLSRYGRDFIARAGGTWTFTMIGAHLAESLVALGDVPAALAIVEETRALFDGGERWGESELHVALSRIHAHNGDREAARSALHTAIEVALAQKARPFEAKARLALGQLLDENGEHESARVELASARARFEELDMPWHKERAERALARAANKDN